MSGAELIGRERSRQISKEGYTLDHDASHNLGELAMAAACYCAPAYIFSMQDAYANQIHFVDPWPFSNGDKRYSYGDAKENSGNILPNPSTYSKEERIDLLIKAGALIAAEIDRLQYVK